MTLQARRLETQGVKRCSKRATPLNMRERLPLEQAAYLSKLVGQNFGLRYPGAFKSFEAAQGTLAGVELMHMIKKRQMIVEEGNEGLTAAE